MSKQFKPGDLAILKSSEAEHLIGSVVELVAYVGSEEHMIYEGVAAFNPQRNRIWWVEITSGQTFCSVARGLVSDGFCGEFRLIPLRGDFEPEQQKTKEAEPCA
jgi:hypothetical protein